MTPTSGQVQQPAVLINDAPSPATPTDAQILANKRQIVLRGIAWNTLYQFYIAFLSFGAMLVLVRIIPSKEYGRAGTVVGFLGLFNILNCGIFAGQALQLPENETPDWSLHFSASMWIQAALSIACHILAGCLWFSPTYASIAPLLHIGAIGLLLDAPNRIGALTLHRNMDFRRMRIIDGAGKTFSLAAGLVVALAGGGAYAIVLSSNLLSALSYTIDLLLIRRWRPKHGWWRWPHWGSYRPALRFGMSIAASGFFSTVRGSLDALFLPKTLGFEMMGLINRATALYNLTAGRMTGIVTDSVYPLLPRLAADARQFPRQATVFVQSLFMLGFPIAFFLGLEGMGLTRVFYGPKWDGMRPFIVPGCIFGVGLVMCQAANNTLVAASKLRAGVFVNALQAAIVLPAFGCVLWTGNAELFVWLLAVGEILMGFVALILARSLLERWIQAALLPPLLSSGLATLAVMFLDEQTQRLNWPLPLRLALSGTVFGMIVLTSLRLLFPTALLEISNRVPGGKRVQAMLRLSRA